MKLAIIGAGPCGLSVLREASSKNFECTVFEQSDQIGGLWNYSKNIFDKGNNLPVLSPVYEEMVTNIPKETMAFEDFSYTEPKHSYISHQEVLKYIHDFARHYELLKHIKLNTQVINVEPENSSQWLIKTKNLQTMEIDESVFKAVAVCNGHFHTPYFPTISGINDFKGTIIHSHIYRKAGVFKDKTVLIIGAGPSGSDISRMLLSVAKKVIACYKEKPQCPLDSKIFQKTNLVKYFTENSAVFEDGSKEIIDSIIFCTGYNTVFPFLSQKCGITVKDNWVKPLYKHIINIEHPTMAFINITDFSLTFPLSGLQARFFIAFLTKKFFKTKEEMLQNMEKDIDTKREQGVSLRYTHQLGPLGMKTYCEELATTAGIQNIQTVVNKIFAICFCQGFRSRNYKILNNEEFEEF